MRALVLATRFYGPGGAEAYSRLLARALMESGIDVEVLALLAGEGAEGAALGRYLGLRARRSTPWAKIRLAAEVVRRGKRYTLVICTHVAVAPLAAMLQRLYGTPYLVVGHGIEVWGGLEKGRRAALRRAARVIAVSHFTADRLATFQGVGRERLAVVHPCVDPELFSLAEVGRGEAMEGPLTFLTVARLSAQERYKGCDSVIRALPAVAARVGSVRYVIAGDGDDRPRLEAVARQQGVGRAVIFIGWVDSHALAVQYRACDVFVMPSMSQHRVDGWTGEGFGIVYLEAAAFGRPVIAGSGGGAAEAVRNGITGLVVDGADVNAVTAALIRLGEDRELRARMGEAGRRWVREHFTFERFRRDIGAVIGALAGREP